jgi:hypothetical protein
MCYANCYHATHNCEALRERLMTSSHYTNSILTVIGLCLVVIVARDLGIISDASAQSQPPTQHVIIAGIDIANDGTHALPVRNLVMHDKVLPLEMYNSSPLTVIDVTRH